MNQEVEKRTQRRVIYKYQLSIYVPDTQKLYIPSTATLRHVDTQGGMISLWFEVDPNDGYVRARHYQVVATGQQFELQDPPQQYIGTVQDMNLVWHVYEVNGNA